jgi:hypothetical protein
MDARFYMHYHTLRLWRKNYMPTDSPAGPGRAFSRGWRALTTMLMFGRKSASYCTHKAATAAICNEDTESLKVALIDT